MTTSKDERRLAERVHEVGDGLGCDVPVAGVLELGDPQGAALAGSVLKSWTSRTVSLSAGIAAGGVVDDVLADLDGVDDRGVGGAAFGLVPVAGEVLRRVDHDRAAAVLDAPERMDLGGQQVLGPPDRMVSGKGLELVLLLGEDSPSSAA